jgi:hypothetical protein
VVAFVLDTALLMYTFTYFKVDQAGGVAHCYHVDVAMPKALESVPSTPNNSKLKNKVIKFLKTILKHSEKSECVYIFYDLPQHCIFICPYHN